jgi:predicted nuclease of predicted toxin-antitoxin system
VKLLLDEHFSPEIASQLVVRYGHDVRAVAADDAMRRLSDAELLESAEQQMRALVTEDVADFLRLHMERIRTHRPHFGLVLTTNRAFPRGPDIGRVVRALDALLRAHPADDALLGMIHWLKPAD